MEKHKLDRQAALTEAEVLFNNGDYAFSVETSDNRLFCKVDWKNATFLGLGTITKEVSTFRYIVELMDDGTFHGYDMDMESMSKADLRGKVRVSSRAFVGHEFRIHKDIGVDVNEGLQTYGFDTRKIHGPVKEFFESRGWVYKEPDVQMIALCGSALMTYKALGVLFSLLGLAGTVMFLSLGVWPPIFLTGLFIVLGFWALGVGLGRPWMPVFSVKMTIKLVVFTFLAAWTLPLLVLLIIVLANGGSL